ncbi:MAG: hypothetical protein HQK65_17530, partial [Desulfamplus sp.]|nr:hypothetical protein [Desulfamplus sp.]
MYRSVRYATTDAGAFLNYTNMIEKGIFFKKNFVYDYQNEPIQQRLTRPVKGMIIQERFQSRIPAAFYNLTINLYRLFPAAERFRFAQLANICLYGIFGLSMFAAFNNAFISS